MSPIAKFELSARQIWASEEDLASRAAHLTHLARAIRSYLQRIDAAGAVESEDEWRGMAIKRGKKYLEHLALDSLYLAEQCRTSANQTLAGPSEANPTIGTGCGPTRQSMNPITHYEGLARQLYASTIDAETKAVRLFTLADAIDKYVHRVRATREVATVLLDPWTRTANDRALDYLADLASDCRKIAGSLPQATPAAPASIGGSA